MKRREFIAKTSHTALAFSLLGLYACKDGVKKIENPDIITEYSGPFFKLSLAQWSLHKAIRDTKTLSNLDFAKKAKQLGFEGVEYVSQLYKLEQNNRLASLNKLTKELKLRSDDSGVENVLIMIDHEGDLSVNNKKSRKKAIADHSLWVDAAAALGCTSVRVNLFGGEAEKEPKQWHANSVEAMGRLSEYAAKSNINVIVENHGGLSSEANKVVAVLKEINLDNCGALPDFGNFCYKRDNGERWGGECIGQYDIYKGTEELMPFAKGISAKTFDFDTDGNETSMDYLRLMRIVKNSGFKGFVGVEYEGDLLGEEEGILATKKLLLKTAKELG